MATHHSVQGKLAIRSAEETDCERLTELMLRSAAYRGRYHSIITDYPVTAEMVRNGEVWIAERNGVIVGFYRLDVTNADLDLMFVDDRHQGGGVGRIIFDHMKTFAASQGLNEVKIVAHPPAADFYRRVGAVDVGIMRAKSADGWDRPILKLDLP